MGGQVSQVFQSGSALLTNGHGHKVSDSTRQKVQTIFDALRANPKIGVQRLEGLLQQLPKNENILAIHDEAGYNLLQKCVGANNVELVRWLLARHSAADVNRFPCSLPLHIACIKGHDECVELLLKHGAKSDVEARMCWPGPHSSNCEERGKYSAAIQQEETCIERDPRERLPSSKLQSAIYYALDGDQVNILTLLSQRGEDPWELINTPDSLGNTPLHALVVRYALEEAQYGYDKWNKWDVLHLVRYLLQNGARPSINHAGNSAVACVLRHVRDWDVCYELLNMLLNDGGVPLINKDPLHHFTHSMKVCYLNCIRILLKKGANPNCSYRANLTPLHVLVFTVSENITLNCDAQKELNFEFIKNILILLLTHGLDPNVRVSRRTEHILHPCMDMVQNVRDCHDLRYVYDLTLTLVQYGANPDLTLSMSEAVKNHPLHAQSCLKILHTQQLSLVPGKMTEPLTVIIRDLYKRPRSLKQICRVKIHNCLGRRPGLYLNKLSLPNQLKDYLLNFEA
ncbi:unnamed protein product [Callosobruchus maculatus]|uniref:SOCS box domain-containing protein n=1 Tax=Callosobruchus maculatus TaxID=64391 RepID=A0A653CX38_CALMS|nr:unnamed protein product [Callosobruchus maculatus]